MSTNLACSIVRTLLKNSEASLLTATPCTNRKHSRISTTRRGASLVNTRRVVGVNTRVHIGTSPIAGLTSVARVIRFHTKSPSPAAGNPTRESRFTTKTQVGNPLSGMMVLKRTTLRLRETTPGDSRPDCVPSSLQGSNGFAVTQPATRGQLACATGLG